MQFPSREVVDMVRKQFPNGCSVELVSMNDPYNTKLQPGCKGTVIGVDDCATIHVSWNCGSSLGVAYGKDLCRRIDE